MSSEDEETHYVYYFERDEGRQAWECQVCSRGGSVGEFGDPELHAEQMHAKDGVTRLAVTSREWGPGDDRLRAKAARNRPGIVPDFGMTTREAL